MPDSLNKQSVIYHHDYVASRHLATPPTDGRSSRNDACVQLSLLQTFAFTNEHRHVCAAKKTDITPEFTAPLSDIDVCEDDDVCLRCMVTGIPEPKVEWMYNDEVTVACCCAAFSGGG